MAEAAVSVLEADLLACETHPDSQGHARQPGERLVAVPLPGEQVTNNRVSNPPVREQALSTETLQVSILSRAQADLSAPRHGPVRQAHPGGNLTAGLANWEEFKDRSVPLEVPIFHRSISASRLDPGEPAVRFDP